MNRLLTLLLAFALPACPAYGTTVTATKASRDGADTIVDVEVTPNDSQGAPTYCAFIEWKDAQGEVIEKHEQCDEDLEAGATDTFRFRLVAKTCATYAAATRGSGTAEVMEGDCPQ